MLNVYLITRLFQFSRDFFKVLLSIILEPIANLNRQYLVEKMTQKEDFKF